MGVSSLIPPPPPDGVVFAAPPMTVPPGGGGLANGFFGPDAAALRIAPALGEGGGRTTPPEFWPVWAGGGREGVIWDGCWGLWLLLGGERSTSALPTSSEFSIGI